MPGIEAVARIAIGSLVVFQLLLLLARVRRCRLKAELGLFSLVLLLLALRCWAPGQLPLREAASFLLVWSLGAHAAHLAAARRLWLWHSAAAAVFAALLLLASLGFYGTFPFFLLTLFCLTLGSLYPLAQLWRAHAASRSGTALCALASCSLLLLGFGYELLAARSGWPQRELALLPTLLYLGCSGYALAQESYLLGSGWQGPAGRFDRQERKLRSAYSRLLQLEDVLLHQDRLVAAGVLAAGAVHEFKNALSAIRLSAEYGLSRRRSVEQRRALESVLEQAGRGAAAAVRYLNLLGRQEREKLELLDLNRHLTDLSRLARASYRSDGIQVRLEVEEGLALAARKGELNQILLSLVANAADCLKQEGQGGEKVIRIAAYRGEESIVLEVTDNGGGVAAELEPLIFESPVSGKGGTGLGLFLARALAARNGGTLDYLPRPQGSCFRLAFARAGWEPFS